VKTLYIEIFEAVNQIVNVITCVGYGKLVYEEVGGEVTLNMQ
jgi:hypothetical protein